MIVLRVVGIICIAFVPAFTSGQGDGRFAPGGPSLEMLSGNSNGGLGAFIALTANPEWEKKFRAGDGPDGLPVLNAVLSAHPGDKLWLVTVFANPLPDRSGNVRVSSHVVVSLPDGSVALDEPNTVCFEGPISGSAQLVRLCNSTLQLGFDPGDQAGIWHIHVTLRDETSKDEVALEYAFELQTR